MRTRELLVLVLPLLFSMSPIFSDEVSVVSKVNKAISVTFNYNTVDFGFLTQGTNDNAPNPSYTTGVYNVTVDTNYAWRVKVSGTDFTDGGSNVIGVGNLTVDTNNVVGSLNPTTVVTTTSQVVDTYSDVGIGITNFHGYLLDIPAYQYATTYTATLTWTYENQ